MAKGQAYRTRAAVLFITAGLVLLLTAYIPSSPAPASTDAARWARVNIPTEGSTGGWVLAGGSNIQHLTCSSDGTLYAYVQGLAYTLYRSRDSGKTWSPIGNVQDAITGIAVQPHDANTIYYATSSSVYRSTDGGRGFRLLPAAPGGAGTNNIEITSIAAAWLDGNIIAIGTRDTDSAEFGSVYTLDEADTIPTWTDTGIGSYDVYAVAFSPSFTTDGELAAVVTDETDTFVTTKVGQAAWGATTGNARLDKDNSGLPTPVAVTISAAIAFPGDYEADAASGSTFFVAIDTGTGQGDAYRISSLEAPASSLATDLNIGARHGLSNIDVTGLSAVGSTPSISLLAGAAQSAQTYFSADGGQSWTTSRKEPTGESRTYVLISPQTGQAYAATSGDESALSLSQDNGSTWNQVSLVDTAISTIIAMAPSPNYSQDKTLFLLTFGSKHSLWRSRDGGQSWARVFSSALAGVDSLKMVSLPPQYGDNCQAVFIAGESGGRTAIWKSTDNAQVFRCRLTLDPTTSATLPIDAWAIANDTTLFLGSYDGSHALVYKTTNSGFTYSAGALAGEQSLNTMALSPGYEQDKTLLVGNTDGWVYYSDDDGSSFKPIPSGTTSPPFTGLISVAFDPEFDKNHIVYAATDTPDGGAHRFTIGTSTDFESLDSTLPGGATLNHITLAGDGTLYAANAKADGGMERCLNSTYASGPTFETVTLGLSDGAKLYGLWSSGHRLWAIDSANNRLMTFSDALTAPVVLRAPDDMAAGIGSLIDHTIRNTSLDWEPLEGANSYEWQLAYDSDLTSVPSGLSGSTQGSSIHLPNLEPATTYHWRVRAKTPALSPWSEKRSFTTSLDTETISITLESPQAGSSGVPVKPLFQWTAVAGADAYELLVSDEADFAHPVIIKEGDWALPATAWKCDLGLDYGTTYYWKVRAIGAGTMSAWSTTGAFTTEPPPTTTAPTTESPPPTPVTTPAPITGYPASMHNIVSPTPTPPPSTVTLSPTTIPPPSLPTWAIYLIGALLLIMILMLIIIMMLVAGVIRR